MRETSVNLLSRKFIKITVLVSWMNMEDKQYLFFWLVLTIMFKFYVFFLFDM